jgi:hypothetical protein
MVTFKTRERMAISPAFMIQKGDFKLILPRIATSPLYDMLYNVKTDRYVSSLALRGAQRGWQSTSHDQLMLLQDLRLVTFW